MNEIDILRREIKELEEDVNRLSSQEIAIKTVLNSGYGAVGAARFRWYDETIAEGITSTGQIAIRYITDKINEFVNRDSGTENIDYVASSDTDSIYFNIDKIVKDRWPNETDKNALVDNINEYAENVVGPYIDQCYLEMSNYLNCDVNLLSMKREAICDTFIIRAKKNYIMRVYDNEGVRYADPQYKMMGIEVVRTSHPGIVRVALRKALMIVIDGNVEDLRTFVMNFREEFMTAKLKDIAAPRGVSDVSKYSTYDHQFNKGMTIPIHVTAAINYNRLVYQLKLGNRYEYVRNGSKVKFLPLIEPNPLKSHVIGMITDLPEEFVISEYIDKESHFDKLFVKPLESFMVYNGWTIKENTLLGLFADDSIDLAKSVINNKKKVKKKVEMDTSSLF